MGEPSRLFFYFSFGLDNIWFHLVYLVRFPDCLVVSTGTFP